MRLPSLLDAAVAITLSFATVAAVAATAHGCCCVPTSCRVSSSFIYQAVVCRCRRRFPREHADAAPLVCSRCCSRRHSSLLWLCSSSRVTLLLLCSLLSPCGCHRHWPRQVVLAAARPCWWLLLLLSPHPTNPLQAGGFAAGCPCWWLLLLLSLHPTSPLQAGGVCSCSSLFVASAFTFSSYLPTTVKLRLTRVVSGDTTVPPPPPSAVQSPPCTRSHSCDAQHAQQQRRPGLRSGANIQRRQRRRSALRQCGATGYGSRSLAGTWHTCVLA